jgi:hypothetical protein
VGGAPVTAPAGSGSRLVLVTGGARSGKSRFAEERLAALAPSGPWRYIATAEALDDEMRATIAVAAATPGVPSKRHARSPTPYGRATTRPCSSTASPSGCRT